jgi:hypothetical protein
MELKPLYNVSKNGGKVETEEKKWDRVVILLPSDVAEEFKRLCDEQYENMSNVGRRLILEWIQEQRTSSTSSRMSPPSA